MPIRTMRDEGDHVRRSRSSRSSSHCVTVGRHRVASGRVEHQPLPSARVDPVVAEARRRARCAARVSLAIASAALPMVLGRCGYPAGRPHPATPSGAGGSIDCSIPAMPPASTAASTRYGFASPPATRFSMRAAFGDRDSTRTAADLSSSPHEATVGCCGEADHPAVRVDVGTEDRRRRRHRRHRAHRSSGGSAPTARARRARRRQDYRRGPASGAHAIRCRTRGSAWP